MIILTSLVLIVFSAIGAIIFYNIGLSILEKFFNFHLKKEPPFWVKRFISEITQFVIPVAIFAVIVILTKLL
jgi:hypothetical protein